MSTNFRKVFQPFRGRRGTKRRTALLRFVGQFLGVDTSVLLITWEELYLQIERDEGKLQAVLKMKAFYNYSLRYSCGLSSPPIPFTRTDKDGFPKKLGKFKPYLLGSPDARRAALTILQLYKLVKVEPPYTLQSVTGVYTGKEDLEWIGDFKYVVNQVFPLDEQHTRISKLKPGFHISGSNGPNGPSLGSAFVDREVIKGTNLEESIKELSSLTGFTYLSGLLTSTSCTPEIAHKNKRQAVHSRIRIKYEPGGKARPFAIVDFFSQSSLKSIHDFTMDWLKGVRTDGSKDHSIAAKAVREWTKFPKLRTWSFDLTTATDRFPVFLQEIVLEQMFGQKIKDCWKDIICNRTFIGPQGEEVRFSVGQPLGALSSWSVFAITHHLLLQTAAFRSFKREFKWFKHYRMIGDDITISGYEPVAKEYKSMLDSLGVNISIDKSVLPEQCSDGNCAEIAKRLFQNGIEVTPLPPNAIIENLENPIGFKNLLENAWDRGYLRAGSPYPVQSIHLNKMEWTSLTFPIRNRTPLFKGVRAIYPGWDPFDNAPAGLDPGWFIWYDVPDEIIEKASRRFLFSKVNDAVEESLSIQQRILLARYMKSEREDLPQGGDWKPGPFDCHPEILTEVFSELQEVLMKYQKSLWDDNILLGDVEDLYKFIGSLHRYLEPKILLTGRSKFRDQKQKTLVFMSSMVKFVNSIVVNNNFDILDQEPEVERFALAEELDFFPLDYE